MQKAFVLCNLLILGSLDKDHNFLLLNSANMVMRQNNDVLAILLKSAAILSNGDVFITKCVSGCTVNELPRPGD